MIFSAEYYSYMYVVIIILQSFSIVGNCFIVTVFLTNYKLRNNKSLYLVLLLCITNALFSLSAFPFTVYQFIMTSKAKTNFNPLLLAMASTPTMMDFKFNLIITIMVAIDRVQAIKYPLFYRNKNHKHFVYLTVAIGLAAGFIDTIIGIVTIDKKMYFLRCPSVGCFQTIVFSIYWSTSNMILQVILFILTFIMIYELSKRMKAKKKPPQLRQNINNNNLQQNSTIKNKAAANRLSLGILFTSFAFLFIPSILLVINDLLKMDLFNRIGPLYTIGLIITGVSNSILYVTLHAEIREAAISLILRRPKNAVAGDTSTNPMTTFK